MSFDISTLAPNRFYLDSVHFNTAFLRHFHTKVVYRVYMTDELLGVIEEAEEYGVVKCCCNFKFILGTLVIKVNKPILAQSGIMITLVEIEELLVPKAYMFQ